MYSDPQVPIVYSMYDPFFCMSDPFFPFRRLLDSHCKKCETHRRDSRGLTVLGFCRTAAWQLCERGPAPNGAIQGSFVVTGNYTIVKT